MLAPEYFKGLILLIGKIDSGLKIKILFQLEMRTVSQTLRTARLDPSRLQTLAASIARVNGKYSPLEPLGP